MVVAHGGSITAFLRHLLNLGVNKGALTEAEVLQAPPNGSYCKLLITVTEEGHVLARGSRIEAVHQIGHL